MRLDGTYAGTVESTQDPEKLGRMKVRVAHVHGVSSGGAGYIATADLPWAMPAGMPAGGSKASGGFSHLPFMGDHVWVRFLDSEPEKPIWEWGMQTFTDRDRMKIHQYDEKPDGSVGNPKAAFWTRYAHAFEINSPGIIITTSKGYGLQFTDGQPADGSVRLYTLKQNYVQLNDLDDGIIISANMDLRLLSMEATIGSSNTFEWTTTAGPFLVESGSTLNLTAVGAIKVTSPSPVLIDSLATLDLTAPVVRLGALAAVEPVVLGLQLGVWLEAFMTYLSLHVHTNGNMGAPTGPPITAPQVSAVPVASFLSKTVFVF